MQDGSPTPRSGLRRPRSQPGARARARVPGAADQRARATFAGRGQELAARAAPGRERLRARRGGSRPWRTTCARPGAVGDRRGDPGPGQGPGRGRRAEAAAATLRRARIDLLNADGYWPEPPEFTAARERLVEVSLLLGDLALREDKFELAEYELASAEVYRGHLEPEKQAFRERLLADSALSRDARRFAAEGDERFAEGRWSAAAAAYQRALEKKPDPELTRRRARCLALAEAEEARSAQDPAREREALGRALDFGAERERWTGRLAELDRALYARALAAGDRAFAAAGERGQGWQAAIDAYDAALAYDPQGTQALVGRADAYALRDLPAGMVLVAIPRARLAEGASAARVDPGETLRFYLDRLGDPPAFAEFVRRGSYAERAVVGRRLEPQRASFVDASGLAAPRAGSGATPMREQEPVTGVSYYEAEACARASSAKRLPTTREWTLGACFHPRTAGARSLGRRGQPQALASFKSLRVGEVGGPDQSPWGALDLGFNVSEWTQGDAPTVKGFSLAFFPHDVEVGVRAWRKTPAPQARMRSLGFRCARDVQAPPPSSAERAR
ncbi:MAG: SUMF1/EgtB/PvdO family nonheme iron enzyme [Planctomycetota bacterium]